MNKKIILLAGADCWVYNRLSGKYDIIRAESTEDSFDLLDRLGDEISAVLIDTEHGSEEDFSVYRKMKNKLRFSFIPVVSVLDGEPEEKELSALELGAAGFIMPCFHDKMLEYTIENAVRLKNSKTYEELESILKPLPSNIYLKDSQCRYIFATHYWHHLDHGDDPNWTIRGKTDVEIRKDRENAIAAMEKDREIVATGKGTSYVIEINADGIQEYMEIFKEPVRNEDGRICGIVGLINNVTEQERLRRKLELASVTDGLTGLFNRSEIQRQIAEALANVEEKKFSLIMADIDNFKTVNDTFGHQAGDAVIQGLAKILSRGNVGNLKCFSSGRWGGEEFMMLLYDTELSAAACIANLLRQCFSNTTFPAVRPQTISVGVAQASCDDTVDSLLSRVDAALYKAKKTGKNRVVVL